MKKLLFSIFLISQYLNLNSQCKRADQSMIIESDFLKSSFSNCGVLWGPDDRLSTGYNTGIIYPKLSKSQTQNGQKEIACIFSGNIWMTGIENGKVKNSSSFYWADSVLNPGPISLNSGNTNSSSENTFNKIWKLSKFDITNFQNLIINNTLPLNIKDIPNNILTWPAKGNSYYTSISPILDEMAPFNDINNNGIYDPINGDFPKIKGDTAFFTIMNDYCKSTGMGLELHLMGYIINSPISNKTIFYDLKVNKKTSGEIDDFIFGLYLDGEIGSAFDDYAGCDSNKNIAYFYNADNFDGDSNIKIYGYNPPVVTCKFINKKMNSFINFARSSNFTIPNMKNANEVRNCMKGYQLNGAPHTWGGNGLDGKVPTKYVFPSDPSDINGWSMHTANYSKYRVIALMSSEPTKLVYNTPKEFNFKISVHENSSFPPKFNDSILPKEELILNDYTSANSLNLAISNVIITPDNNNQGSGSIELTINSKNTPISKWSSGEKNTTKIINKKAGVYNFKIFDGNSFIDTSFTITTKSSAGIASSLTNGFKVYPIPAKNELNIDFNRSQLINSITIQNIEGQVIRVEPIKSAISTYTLSIQDLPKGVYFLQVDGQDLKQVSKFTKE